MSPSTASKITTDHNEILRWAQTRTASPAAAISAKAKSDGRIIHLEFGADGKASLGKPITWEDWFAKFDASKLAFLYQDQLANGEHSNFYQIVEREIAKEVEEAVGGKGRSASRRAAPTRAKVENDNRGIVKPDAVRAATAAKKPVSARGKVSGTARASNRSGSSEKVSSQTDGNAVTHAGKLRQPRTIARAR
jgi:hypothetical protein